MAIGVGNLAPLDPWKYAEYLGLLILDIYKLGISKTAMKQLLADDNESWSAMTLKEGDITAIIVNPSHSPARQRSNLMHEIAHFELRHLPSRIEVSKNTGLLLLSDYSDDQEAEADWYGAALLLPRTALAHYRVRKKNTADIATMYGVSNQLCEWRLRMTGVDLQMRRSYGGA
jgi:Zn-dependent peptidase ImmA (M78 family)